MFRPCIDLHQGRVKQIVGGTLTDDPAGLTTNFISEKPGSWFADLYRKDDLQGGHVIMLGSNNEAAAQETLAAWPGGLQIGGNIQPDNAKTWIAAGASHVIVTSWIFQEGKLDWSRLDRLVDVMGSPRQLVLDLSCRKRDGEYFVVTNRWKTFTDLTLSQETLDKLSAYCDEFLIHAVDVEGLCQGIDLELVEKLSQWTPITTTYAGGAKSLDDLATVSRLGQGRIGLTIGSALDIFGGQGIKYADAVAFNRNLYTQHLNDH